MHIDSFFACSNSNLEDSEYVVFGIPYDSTQSFKPGSRFAPTAIREASWNFEDFSVFFRKNLDVKVCDAGNVCVDGSFEDVIAEVKNFLDSIKGKTPIAFGGEHTVSYAISCAISNFNFDFGSGFGSDLPFVIFDAHFDLRDEFDGDKYNHACTTRRIFENQDEIILIGVRSCTKEELEFAESNGIKYFTSFEIMKNPSEFIKLIERYIPEKFYLSVDTDVFDPAFAPGVSTPEPFGITPFEYLRFIEAFSNRICGIDFVEVIPDSEKVTPCLVAKLAYEFLFSRS